MGRVGSSSDQMWEVVVHDVILLMNIHWGGLLLVKVFKQIHLEKRGFPAEKEIRLRSLKIGFHILCGNLSKGPISYWRNE